MIALVLCAGTSAAARPARPPPMARAEEVATAWLRAAARRRIPASSGPAITIDASTYTCRGDWDRAHLRAALRCVAMLLARGDLPVEWDSVSVRGNTRDLVASIGVLLTVQMTVDAGGHVLAVALGEGDDVPL